MKYKASYLLIWIISLQLTGYLSGSATQISIAGWYNDLVKSSLTPPPITFGIVWSLLYLMIAIAGWIIFSNKNKDFRIGRLYYTGQLLLNWSWTSLFFHYKLLFLSLLCILLIILMTIMVIIKTYKHNKILIFMLVPYLIWLIFASYLNLFIYLYN